MFYNKQSKNIEYDVWYVATLTLYDDRYFNEKTQEVDIYRKTVKKVFRGTLRECRHYVSRETITMWKIMNVELDSWAEIRTNERDRKRINVNIFEGDCEDELANYEIVYLVV